MGPKRILDPKLLSCVPQSSYCEPTESSLALGLLWVRLVDMFGTCNHTRILIFGLCACLAGAVLGTRIPSSPIPLIVELLVFPRKAADRSIICAALGRSTVERLSDIDVNATVHCGIACLRIAVRLVSPFFANGRFWSFLLSRAYSLSFFQEDGGATNGCARLRSARTRILDWPIQTRWPLLAVLRCKHTLRVVPLHETT